MNTTTTAAGSPDFRRANKITIAKIEELARSLTGDAARINALKAICAAMNDAGQYELAAALRGIVDGYLSATKAD